MKALTFVFFAVVLAISIANAVQGQTTDELTNDTTSVEPLHSSNNTSTAASQNVTTATEATNSNTNSPSTTRQSSTATIPKTSNNKTTTKKPKKAKSNAVTISNLPPFIIILVSSLQYVVGSYWKN